MAEHHEIQTLDPFYNCSECSSLIEIIYIDNKEIEFKCFNPKGSHKKRMPIEDYINKMKIHNIQKNDEKCMIKEHYKNYESYCLECNKHLCEKCLKSREHLLHNTINIKEFLPKINELNLLDTIIQYLENKKEFKLLSNLYEIIYNTYNKTNNNYYYCININFIIISFMEKNKDFKNKVTSEEYENLIKIKKRKEKINQVNDDILNNLLDKTEEMKSHYEKEIINLKEIIDNYKNEIDNLKNGENLNKINDDSINKNMIGGIIDINSNEINNKIHLFNTDFKEGIDVYLNNKKINMIKDNNMWIIDSIFIKKEGKYSFKIIFNNIMNNMQGFFAKCSNIISLDFSNFDSSNVINMSYMFNNCNKLKEIKGINTIKTNNVVEMTAIFQFCSQLEYLNLTNFDISNVTDISYMFNNCNKLKYIKGINTIKTNKAIKMNSMFQACYELDSIDLLNFDTSKVINMSYMFNKCYKLKEIKGIKEFKTNEVKDMNCMFQLCYELEYLNLSNFDTSKVTDFSYMFNNCNKLKEIKGVENFKTNEVTNMKAMFQSCYELEKLDLSKYDTSKVSDMSYMFNNCNKLKYLNILNFTINRCDTKNMLKFKRENNCEFITNNEELKKLYKSSL